MPKEDKNVVEVWAEEDPGTFTLHVNGGKVGHAELSNNGNFLSLLHIEPKFEKYKKLFIGEILNHLGYPLMDNAGHKKSREDEGSTKKKDTTREDITRANEALGITLGELRKSAQVPKEELAEDFAIANVAGTDKVAGLTGDPPVSKENQKRMINKVWRRKNPEIVGETNEK